MSHFGLGGSSGPTPLRCSRILGREFSKSRTRALKVLRSFYVVTPFWGPGGIGMDKEDHLNALLQRAKELKEIGEKLIRESDQLMKKYEALKPKRRGRARTSFTPE
jgi:hypothetical protein